MSLGKNVAGITGNDASGIRPDSAQPQGSMRPSLPWGTPPKFTARTQSEAASFQLQPITGFIFHHEDFPSNLYSSPDLTHWKFENWLVKSSDLPADCPYKHRFWAAEIHKIHGKFYLIFTADNWIKNEYNRGGKIGAYVAFVGVADDVTGPYRHVTWLKGAGCDTTLFEDDDGKTYAIMPFGNEYIQEVNLRGIEKGDIKLIGPRKLIVASDNSDVNKNTSPDYLEGPWMIKRNGKYILFTAAPYRGPKPGAAIRCF